MAGTTRELLDALSWRYATKKFDPSRAIPDGTWTALERALVLAPSSFGLQPWRFVVVTDKSTREALLPHSWNQTQVVDASHLVVFAARTTVNADDVKRHLDRIAEVRGVPRASLDAYGSMMLGFVEKPAPGFDLGGWAARQVYIALGQFMASAALLGVDTCPMEGIDAAAYDRVLGLPAQGYRTWCVCPAGYRAPDDPYAAQPKVRYPHEMVLRRV
ncbi:MAG: NAD(P)H-dependent oxidoreductase [Phycisphaerae bacterium]|nr:NAD(P)H-dependent oxidoreductase [Phycisphaerae bacterium]